MKNFYFLLLYLCLCHTITAQNKSNLWEISGNGLSKPSYLLGLIHLRDTRLNYFSDEVYEYLKKTDAFALEWHPDSLLLYVKSRLFDESADFSQIQHWLDGNQSILPYSYILESGINFLENDYPSNWSDTKPINLPSIFLYDLALKQNKPTYNLVTPDMHLPNTAHLNLSLGIPLAGNEGLEEMNRLIALYNQAKLGDTIEIMMNAKNFADENLKDWIDKQKSSIYENLVLLMQKQSLFSVVGMQYLNAVLEKLSMAGFTVREISQSKSLGMITQHTPENNWRRYFTSDSSFSIESPYPMYQSGQGKHETAWYIFNPADKMVVIIHHQKPVPNLNINNDSLYREEIMYRGDYYPSIDIEYDGEYWPINEIRKVNGANVYLHHSPDSTEFLWGVAEYIKNNQSARIDLWGDETYDIDSSTYKRIINSVILEDKFTKKPPQWKRYHLDDDISIELPTEPKISIDSQVYEIKIKYQSSNYEFTEPIIYELSYENYKGNSSLQTWREQYINQNILIKSGVRYDNNQNWLPKGISLFDSISIGNNSVEAFQTDTVLGDKLLKTYEFHYFGRWLKVTLLEDSQNKLEVNRIFNSIRTDIKLPNSVFEDSISGLQIKYTGFIEEYPVVQDFGVYTVRKQIKIIDVAKNSEKLYSIAIVDSMFSGANPEAFFKFHLRWGFKYLKTDTINGDPIIYYTNYFDGGPHYFMGILHGSYFITISSLWDSKIDSISVFQELYSGLRFSSPTLMVNPQVNSLHKIRHLFDSNFNKYSLANLEEAILFMHCPIVSPDEIQTLVQQLAIQFSKSPHAFIKPDNGVRELTSAETDPLDKANFNDLLPILAALIHIQGNRDFALACLDSIVQQMERYETYSGVFPSAIAKIHSEKALDVWLSFYENQKKNKFPPYDFSIQELLSGDNIEGIEKNISRFFDIYQKYNGCFSLNKCITQIIKHSKSKIILSDKQLDYLFEKISYFVCKQNFTEKNTDESSLIFSFTDELQYGYYNAKYFGKEQYLVAWLKANFTKLSPEIKPEVMELFLLKNQKPSKKMWRYYTQRPYQHKYLLLRLLPEFINFDGFPKGFINQK